MIPGGDPPESRRNPRSATCAGNPAGQARALPVTCSHATAGVQARLPAFASNRDLPVFALVGRTNGARDPASYAVAVERCEMALCDAVDARLPGTVRYCTRLVRRGHGPTSPRHPRGGR